MTKRWSWGRYPAVSQSARPIAFADQLPAPLARAAAAGDTLLPHGNGRSYGDSCLAASGNLVALRPLDRFVAFDPEQGLLTAEAGVTLGEIVQLTLPHGWFLPVTPGTRHATLGGAIANDVHGKNHHRAGTFGRFVEGFTLVRSDQGRLTVSRDEHADLFAATIGGLGLTGVIEQATIRLKPVRSSHLDVLTTRFRSLDEFFALSAEHDEAHEFAVSWVDCTASGAALGRGIYAAADFADDGDFSAPATRTKSVPVTPPLSAINPLSVRLFNEAYWRNAPPRPSLSRQHYQPFFYPLDHIGDWNRLYGPKGFQQFQAVFPTRNEQAGIRATLAAIHAAGQGSFLAVLKRCGDLPSPGLLSFPMAGTSLAIDFANRRGLAPLLDRLDALVADHGGRLYPAKDAHMPPALFRATYPAWADVERLRDPALLSLFWQRVTR